MPLKLQRNQLADLGQGLFPGGIFHILEGQEDRFAFSLKYLIRDKRKYEQIVSAYAEQYQITKIRGLIPAGQSGILSVLNGLTYIESKYSSDDIVIFQESTRPMVNVDTISKLLQSVYENGFANICQPMKDILQFTTNGSKASYVDRDSVVEVQSPEAYRIEIIRNVFEEAKKQQHPLMESCCAMLMYNLGFDINFIEGSATNYKIIRQEDIAIVTAMIQGR